MQKEEAENRREPPRWCFITGRACPSRHLFAIAEDGAIGVIRQGRLAGGSGGGGGRIEWNLGKSQVGRVSANYWHGM